MRIGGTELSAVQQMRDISARNATLTDSQSQGQQAAQVSVSKPAEMIQKLRELQGSDPEKFKSLVGELAERLKDASKTQSGSSKQALTDMAERLSQAAETGDLSVLAPAQEPDLTRPPSGALEAYERNKPHAPPPDENVNAAMKEALKKLDEATSE